MYSIKELSLTFLVGGLTYGLLEILFRGYTHWTMLITGGICFLLFYIVNSSIKTNSIFIRCLFATLIITTLEFIVGYIVNIIFKLNVWDYSGIGFNFMGQICLLYSTVWFSMGIPMTFVANLIKNKF